MIIKQSVIYGLIFLLLGGCYADVKSNSQQSVDINFLENLLSAKEGSIVLEKEFSKKIDFNKYIEISSIKYEPRNSLLLNIYHCALIFTARGELEQVVVTVGEGITETLSCNGLVDLALFDYHLGMIYGYQSPNVTFNGGLILTFDSQTNRWRVNEVLSTGDVVSSEVSSIKVLEKYVPN